MFRIVLNRKSVITKQWNTLRRRRRCQAGMAIVVTIIIGMTTNVRKFKKIMKHNQIPNSNVWALILSCVASYIIYITQNLKVYLCKEICTCINYSTVINKESYIVYKQTQNKWLKPSTGKDPV